MNFKIVYPAKILQFEKTKVSLHEGVEISKRFDFQSIRIEIQNIYLFISIVLYTFVYMMERFEFHTALKFQYAFSNHREISNRSEMTDDFIKYVNFIVSLLLLVYYCCSIML